MNRFGYTNLEKEYSIEINILSYLCIFHIDGSLKILHIR